MVRRQRFIVVGALTCLASLLVYLALFSVFVFNVPTAAKAVIVLGCGFTDDARAVATLAHIDAGFGCPGSYQRLLQSAQYEASEIWTRWSILAVQMAIFVSWLLTLSALSIALFTFAAGQKGAPAKPGSRRRAPG